MLWSILPSSHCWGYRPGTLSCSQVSEAHLRIKQLVMKCMGAWSSNRLQWLDLTHWGRVTHICVSKLSIIGSDNGLSPGRRQAIIWTNDGILLIGPLGTNFSEILIKIYIFSFKKMHLKISSGNWQPFCLCLNVLKIGHQDKIPSNGCQGDIPYYHDCYNTFHAYSGYSMKT